MADISKLNIEGIEYDIKDTTARSQIPTIDQTYNNKSENPQSGVAVAEALTNSVADWNATWSGSPSYIKNKPTIPITFHIMFDDGYGSFELPDALEWYKSHLLEGCYVQATQVGYSEPVIVVDSDGSWTCKHVWYTYAEIDEENYTEDAWWEDFGFAKASDIPQGNKNFGTQIDDTTIKIFAATESAITSATNQYQPIVPSNLGYGVGTHGIARFSTMPAAERKYWDWIVLYTGETDETYTKNSFYTCILDPAFPPELIDGVLHEYWIWVEVTLSQIGDIESALDSIIAIQNSLMGGDA